MRKPYLLALAVASIWGCSSASADSTFDNKLPLSDGGSGSGGGTQILDGSDIDGTLNEAGSCAATGYDGKLVPLDLYFMMDQSGSMDESGKWGSVVSALQEFLSSPDANGIGVGIQYFPLKPSSPIPGPCATNANCGVYGPCLNLGTGKVCAGSMAKDSSCVTSDYSKPEVGIALLPDAKQNMIDSIDKHSPTGDATPTQFALDGAMVYAVPWAAANPSHIVLVVFATDGEPTGCSTDLKSSTNNISNTSAIADKAAKGNPSVRTFVIGVGSSLSSLDEIAKKGGTDKAFLVDTGGNVSQQFLDALNEIRAAGACKYQIPKPSSGDLDYSLVNVTYKQGTQAEQTIGMVSTAADCSSSQDGWYYDNPANPAKILLCPSTCDKVRTHPDVVVNILLGCKTVVN